MEVLWVCAQDPDFHVYYCEGPRQVTVLVFTPRPRGHTDLPLNHSESIWVVKVREPSDDQYPRLGMGIPAAQVVATVQIGATTREVIQTAAVLRRLNSAVPQEPEVGLALLGAPHSRQTRRAGV
jgi:hypothetical protein